MISVASIKISAAIATISLLSACGGGGGGASNSAGGFGTNDNNTKPQVSSVASSANSLSSQAISTSQSSSSRSSNAFSNIDTTPPSTLTRFVVQKLAYDRVILEWSSALDNVDVIFYKIYRDSVLIDTVFNTTNTYYDYYIAAGKNYVYSISAGDASGNWSPLSYVNVITPNISNNLSSQSSASSISSSSPDTTNPTPPDQVFQVSVLSSQVDISWTPATDNIGITAYRVYRDGLLLGTLDPETMKFSDQSTSSGNSYWYGVSAGDAAGNWSVQKLLNITTPLPLTSGITTLKWLAPTQRESGAALLSSEIGGYKIRYKTITDGNYIYTYVTNSQNQITINNLIGDFTFDIAVFDIDGRYSDFVSISPQ